jgi:hypothetical protein
VILCLHCQSLSEPDGNNCKHCGATLPKLAYKAEMLKIDNITILYDMLRALAGALVNSKVSLDDFEDYVGHLGESLEVIGQEINEIEFDEDIKEEFEEELEFGLEGINAVYEGLELLMEYGDEEDVDCLVDGLEAIRDGVVLINKARAINREREALRGKFVTLYKEDNSMDL